MKASPLSTIPLSLHFPRSVSSTLPLLSLAKKVSLLALLLIPILILVVRYLRSSRPGGDLPPTRISPQRSRDPSPFDILRSTILDLPKEGLLGVWPHRATGLAGSEISIDFVRGGTPGVNVRGTDPDDLAYVQQRAAAVRVQLGPHAHTNQSWIDYQKKSADITFQSLQIRNPALRPEEVVASHNQGLDLMKKTFGKQLSMTIIGAGPIGLAAALAFYKLGFKVQCFEKRTEKDCSSRQNPFGLMRQSLWLLQGLGISQGQILHAFGYSEESLRTFDQRREGTLEGYHFRLMNLGMIPQKLETLGKSARDYIPNSLSLEVGSVQQLLLASIDNIRQINPSDLEVFFGSECVGSNEEEGTVTFRNDHTQEVIVSDMVYNASGGRVNDQLGFETIKTGTYFGMGAFFPKPERPREENPPKQLSRAVRVFCDERREAPIYCNVELSKDEYEKMKKDERPNPQLMEKVCHDVGLTEGPIRAFPVQIHLQHVQTAAKQKRRERDVPQVTFCGGDSVLYPHFITASGANFGFQGLLALNHLLSEFVEGKIAAEQVIEEYNRTASLLQRQSMQVILELFGREPI